MDESSGSRQRQREGGDTIDDDLLEDPITSTTTNAPQTPTTTTTSVGLSAVLRSLPLSVLGGMFTIHGYDVRKTRSQGI